MAVAFSAGRSAACGALLGSATERSRVWRWRALRSSRAACGAFTFARSMPAAEVDTGRLNSRDARTALATLRQVAADGRAAPDGRVASEGSAAEGMRQTRRHRVRERAPETRRVKPGTDVHHGVCCMWAPHSLHTGTRCICSRLPAVFTPASDDIVEGQGRPVSLHRSSL